jgi:two-component system chemotaxis response regulator CheB
MRTALTRMIDSDAALKLAATAMNGNEALEKVDTVEPDVVTLDIEMPGLNGLETLRRIMTECPRPVIMVSSLTQQGAEARWKRSTSAHLTAFPSSRRWQSWTL